MHAKRCDERVAFLVVDLLSVSGKPRASASCEMLAWPVICCDSCHLLVQRKGLLVKRVA